MAEDITYDDPAFGQGYYSGTTPAAEFGRQPPLPVQTPETTLFGRLRKGIFGGMGDASTRVAPSPAASNPHGRAGAGIYQIAGFPGGHDGVYMTATDIPRTGAIGELHHDLIGWNPGEHGEGMLPMRCCKCCSC